MSKRKSLKWLLPVLVILILVYVSLIFFWNPMPKTIEFKLDPQSKTNFSTAHFSFFIDEVENDDSGNEVSSFITTKKGLINFDEQAKRPYTQNPELINSEGIDELPYNSIMNLVINKEVRLSKKLSKMNYIKQMSPIFFHSADVKAVLLTIDGSQLLELSDPDDKYVLMILVDYEIDRDEILKVLESVRFREN